MFPPEVKSWFSDDLLTKIYRNVDKVFICPNIKFCNRNRVGQTNEKSGNTTKTVQERRVTKQIVREPRWCLDIPLLNHEGSGNIRENDET